VALNTSTLHSLLIAVTAFGGVTAVALGLRHLAFRTVHRWAAATTTRMDDVIIQSLRIPSLLWCVLLGLYVGMDLMPLGPRPMHVALNVIYSLMVVSVTAAIAAAAGAMLRQGLAQAHLAIPATGLSVTFITVAIWIIGGLVLLGGLGISITPVLTALGVGGLAVALALQETLSNFFAGLHLLIEKPIRVGDFIKLETGQEGYVVDIGWRTTRIRMLPNNMVILPNAKVTQSIVTNYYLPEPSMALLIPVSVSYAADPDHVERVLVEETRLALGNVPGLLTEPAPFIRFLPGFGESSLNFTLICHVREYSDQYLAQHELHKRILRRFKQEGIEIPFPQRTVHLQTHSGAAASGGDGPLPHADQRP
jgi:small-conductance mechanosensitive channel